jgi:hypothetical protein
MRLLISKLPNTTKSIVTDILAFLIYLPISIIYKKLDKLNFRIINLPLSYYTYKSIYTMRTDCRDRFGTPLEKRFSKNEIITMLVDSNFENIRFSNSAPYWCAVAYKKIN